MSALADVKGCLPGTRSCTWADGEDRVKRSHAYSKLGSASDGAPISGT